jgi:hypothetical protein
MCTNILFVFGSPADGSRNYLKCNTIILYTDMADYPKRIVLDECGQLCAPAI